MKRTLFILMLAAAAFGCKKSSTTPQFNISGKWTLSSIGMNDQVATAAQYPCIANASLVFGSGNTTTVGWVGSDPCVINQAGNETFAANNGAVLTFTRKGNDLYFPPASSAASTGHATVASVNGKLQLTLRDTLTLHYEGGTTTTYNANVYIKQ